MILLIHPPVTLAAEPPAGLARLAGALDAAAFPHRLWDANVEGLLYLTGLAGEAPDPWTRRARRHRAENLARLKDPATYLHRDRYARAVADVNRIVEKSSPLPTVKASLGNYRDRLLSPLKGEDLLTAASRYEDNLFFPFFGQRLAELMDEYRPSRVGISLNYLHQALVAFSLLGFLKKNFGDTKTLVGGGLVGSWIKSGKSLDFARNLVDCWVSGPGEEAVLPPGWAKRKELFSLPAYDGFPWEDYLAPKRILPYNTSYGCVWRKCSFCPEQAEGSSYRATAPSRVVKELNHLVLRHQPGLIHLVDNALSLPHLRALASSPPGVGWYGFTRVSPALADPEFCRALKDSGCILLQLGVESGDAGVLKRLQKGITPLTAASVLKNLKAVGIATYVYLLFGTPEEDEAAARRTLDFVIRQSHEIDFLNLALFNLPTAGSLARLQDRRRFYEADLSLYTDFRHPAGWDRRQVRRFLTDEFITQPDIAPIIRREPPFFGSLHAPFLI